MNPAATPDGSGCSRVFPEEVFPDSMQVTENQDI
jgi:hypothetical protein